MLETELSMLLERNPGVPADAAQLSRRRKNSDAIEYKFASGSGIRC